MYDDIDQMIATANSVKDRLRRRAEVTGDEALPKATAGAMIGVMNKYLGGDAYRRLVFSWLFAGDFELLSQKSSKSLTLAQKWALVEWIEWWKDDEGSWHVGSRFPHEAICVMNAAIKAYISAENVSIKRDFGDPFSIVANAVEMGGIVTKITDLSKIDKDTGKE